MSDVEIRTSGAAGRITLNRPEALNALTWEMCRDIEAALDSWAIDDDVALVVIDGVGERAFCAGGDVAEMYRHGLDGDYAFGQAFWSDEYRMNAKIYEFPKPYVSFMQGYTMGGGVGVACHGSHRIIGETSKLAMPECAIGLIPDVGGTLLLAQAAGRLGEYLSVTGYRMGAGDAIYAGFADYFIPEADWPALIARLEETGNVEEVDQAAGPAPTAPLSEIQRWIDASFHGSTIADVTRGLKADDSADAKHAQKAITGGSPLSAACAYDAVGRVRGVQTIRHALDIEHRFTYRAVEHGDFLEGVRAAIIDKDRSPKWKHASIFDVSQAEVAQMLMPLGENRLRLNKE